MKIKKITSFLCFSLTFLLACSRDEERERAELKVKLVTMAKGNISFLLPDTSLTYSKQRGWGPCCSSCSYDEMRGFFHNHDTSVMVSLHVTAFPDAQQRVLPWYVIANEKQQRYVISAKNRGMAVIEHYAADSSSRTIDIEYHLPKRPGPSRRGQANYARDLTFYGLQRTIHFCFFGPDNEAVRKAMVTTKNSVRIERVYLQASIKPYPESQYFE